MFGVTLKKQADMDTVIFLTGMMEVVSEFVNSNVIATFLIAVGIIIMLGVAYGTKLWHDIHEIQKTLAEMEKDDSQESD